MAEYDKRRLYWIKLTDRFFSSDTVDFLMSQQGGANYVVLYQMLCLKTVNNGGVLVRTLGEVLIPYDIEKIQRDCKWFAADTVRVALELYKKLGLIYENQNGYLAISEFDKMIGSQSYGAEKKEDQKRRREQALTEGGKKVENFPPDKDKEKYIYIDIIDKYDQYDQYDQSKISPLEKFNAPCSMTKKLIDSGYIDKNDSSIDDYNAVFGELIAKYSFEMVRSCLWYFISRWKKDPFDTEGNEIENKFAYFRTSVMNGIKIRSKK